MRLRIHRRARIVGTLLGLPAAIIATGYVLGFRWTRTPSIPPGIYRLSENPRDPLVSFCPSGVTSQESVTRGYRSAAWTCPDHHAPLLKPIAARPGDKVTITAQGIAVNGALLRNSKAVAFDGLHRPMHIWPTGAYTVPSGWVWVISTYNPASYDSRYYGPIQIASVHHYAHPVWQFH